MTITNGNTEVEVRSGHSVYVENEANKEEAAYTKWGDLKEDKRLEIEELTKEISEKTERLKRLILSCSGTSDRRSKTA